MTEILKSSFIYKLCAAVGRWFSGQWLGSRIIRAFVNMKDEADLAEGSIFYRAGAYMRRLQCSISKALKFDKLFADSIFAMPFLWCFFAVVLAPLIPTMVMLAFILLGFIAVIIRAGIDEEHTLMRAPINRYVIIYAIIYFIATFTSVTVSGSLYVGLLSVALIMSVLMIENAVRNQRQFDILVKAMVMAGLIVALYGIYQHFFGTGGGETWVDEDMFSEISTRVYSTLQNPNVLSEYLLLVIPLAAAWMFAAEGFIRKAFYFIVCAVMCLCMVYTFSRGGWLGLLFAVFIFLILVDRRFIFLIIAGAVALLLFSPDIIVQRFTSIGNVTDTSTSYRVSIWMGTLKMLKDYWLTGIGPGTAAFNMVYPAYSYNTVSAPHAHNLYLQIVCDAGIAGIIVFAILIIVFIRMNCHGISVTKNRKAKLMQIASLSGAGGFLVQSMTDYSFYNYRVMFLFWAYLAISALACRYESLSDDRHILRV